MNLRTTLLVLPMVFLLVACSGGSPFSGPVQKYAVILEMGQIELLQRFANNPKSPEWEAVISETKKIMAEGEEDALEAFKLAWRGKAKEQKMVKFFYNRKYARLFEKNMSNDEVIKTLYVEFDQAGSAIRLILEKRLEDFGAEGEVKYNPMAMRFTVELSSEAELPVVRQMLSSTANLELYETYELTELTGWLSEVMNQIAPEEPDYTMQPEVDTAAIMAEDEWETDLLASDSMSVDELLSNEPEVAEEPEQGIFEYLQLAISDVGGMYSPNKGAMIGACKVSDTSEVNAMLQDLINLSSFPRDAKLCWGAQPERYWNEDEQADYFGLYAIKVDRSGSGVMSGSDIVDARSEFNNETGSPEVRCTLNSPGSRRFSELTMNNVDRAIAIVVDDQVWSAPIVREQIEGGVFTISGQEVDECYTLAILLRVGSFPAPVRIVDEKVIG